MNVAGALMPVMATGALVRIVPDATFDWEAMAKGAGGDLMRTREANRKKLAETEKKDASDS